MNLTREWWMIFAYVWDRAWERHGDASGKENNALRRGLSIHIFAGCLARHVGFYSCNDEKRHIKTVEHKQTSSTGKMIKVRLVKIYDRISTEYILLLRKDPIFDRYRCSTAWSCYRNLKTLSYHRMGLRLKIERITNLLICTAQSARPWVYWMEQFIVVWYKREFGGWRLDLMHVIFESCSLIRISLTN